ncbi:MAG: YkgJ family cysteine cluster protein [Desulfobacterales bacterium]|nr:YkgJ family cysteine cluster protein [Desulfobacterales bacterium]
MEYSLPPFIFVEICVRYMENRFINEILSIYSKIDVQVEAFRSAVKLHCLSGCGICCTSTKVEANAIELLPLAQELFHRGEAEFWMERAQAAHYEGACIFYDPKPQRMAIGHCRFYAWRPSVCRLFGFSKVKDKTGKPKLAACIIQKNIMPYVIEKAEKSVSHGMHYPGLTNFFLQIMGMTHQAVLCQLTERFTWHLRNTVWKFK